MTAFAKFDFQNVSLEVSILSETETACPWRKDGEPMEGNVFKYLISVHNPVNGVSIEFDYHTSTHDCNSQQVQRIVEFNKLLQPIPGESISSKWLTSLCNIAEFRGHTWADKTAHDFLKANFANFKAAMKGVRSSPWQKSIWTLFTMARAIHDTMKKPGSPDISSLVGYDVAQKHLDAEGLKFALDCFVNEASGGGMSIDEFCDYFGYNGGGRTISEILKIHRACQRAKSDFDRLGAGDIYDLLNEMSELGFN